MTEAIYNVEGKVVHEDNAGEVVPDKIKQAKGDKYNLS